VFFRSDQSGPARRTESLIAHLARKDRDHLRVRSVDVDECPNVTKRFRVKVVPTLVLAKDKRTVARLEGGSSAPKIEAMLAGHVDAESPTSKVA